MCRTSQEFWGSNHDTRFVFKCIFEGTLQLQVTGPSPTPYTVNFEDPSETFETGSFVEVIATVRQTGKETYELDHSPEFAAINLSEDPTFGIFFHFLQRFHYVFSIFVVVGF